MDNQTQEIIQRGKALDALQHHEGWRIVQQLLEKFEGEAALDLIDYRGSDPEVLRYKQVAARITRAVNRAINLHIKESINDAEQAIEMEIDRREEEYYE